MYLNEKFSYSSCIFDFFDILVSDSEIYFRRESQCCQCRCIIKYYFGFVLKKDIFDHIIWKIIDVLNILGENDLHIIYYIWFNVDILKRLLRSTVNTRFAYVTIYQGAVWLSRIVSVHSQYFIGETMQIKCPTKVNEPHLVKSLSSNELFWCKYIFTLRWLN